MTTYKESGVDIDAGNSFVDMVRACMKKAWPKGETIGGFAGGGPIPKGARMFKASTDGTGTKIILAALLEQFDGIGQDAVAMGLGDAYAAGVWPSYGLDTLKVASLIPEKHIQIIESVVTACKDHSCRLVGGETAEHPDMFKYPWMIDLDFTVIGFLLPRFAPLPVKPGQKVYGWASSGPGANGYSLLRKVFGLRQSPSKARARLERYIPDLHTTLADLLLKPTPIWISRIERHRRQGIRFAGHAHITGGGLVDNIPRILPPACKVVLDRRTWQRPWIFCLAQGVGKIPMEEMDRAFNQGIMMVSIVSEEDELFDPWATCIGSVEKRKGDEPQVQFIGDFQE